MKKSICLLICLFFGLIMLCGCKKDNTPEQSYSKYFENNSGCAVFFKDNEYYTYNYEIANIQKSPCSTFKIVLTLAGLKYGRCKMRTQSSNGTAKKDILMSGI